MDLEGLKAEEVTGEGTPVIFVHGWLGSRESWTQVRAELELENPLVFYDQRCHGDSSCSKFLIEDLAKDLGKIIQKMDNEPVLVGHSMGGMAALKYASTENSYSGLILLGTCASTPRPKYRSPEFFLEKLGKMARTKWAEMIADNYAEDSTEVRKGALQELKEAGKEPVINGLKAMINYDVRESLGEENAVVIAGKKDSAIPVEQGRELSKSLGCTLEIIDSSHLMLQEEPSKVAKKIEEFVHSGSR